MTTDIKRVVILGHSGFIGSRLETILKSMRPDLEILGRSLPEMDLADISCIDTLAAQITPESAVVLCAAVKRQFGDTLEVWHKNMTIVENVLAALNISPAGRVLFMSSAAVYGEETHNVSIHEGTLPHPASYYGIAKYTGECILRKGLSAHAGTGLVCLRPPLIYGPGDKGKSYGPAGFCASAIEKNPITLWGDGDELREFVYVDDLCHIIIHLAMNTFTGPVNIVSGKSYRFSDVIKIIRSCGYENIVVNQKPRSKQKVDNAFRGELLKSLLPSDFEFTSLESGVRATLNHYLNHE